MKAAQPTDRVGHAGFVRSPREPGKARWFDDKRNKTKPAAPSRTAAERLARVRFVAERAHARRAVPYNYLPNGTSHAVPFVDLLSMTRRHSRRYIRQLLESRAIERSGYPAALTRETDGERMEEEGAVRETAGRRSGHVSPSD